jgi:hypothetical protein
MKYRSLVQLAVLIFLPFLAAAETTFTGIIVDKKTQQFIPFATIGLIKENTGTSTDSAGNFNLMSERDDLTDTLLVCSIGYECQKIPAKELLKPDIVIELVSNGTAVRGKADPSGAQSEVALDEFKTCSNLYQTATDSTSQLAQLFEAPGDGMNLMALKICTDGGTVASEKSVFRIRVYSAEDAAKGPSKELYTAPIEVDGTGKKVVEVDLTPYQIKLPKRQFFVSVEWLKVTRNRNLQSSRIKYDYAPCISFKKSEDQQQVAWALNYNGKWIQLKGPDMRKTAIMTSIVR